MTTISAHIIKTDIMPEQTLAVWDRAADIDTRRAIDRVLAHMMAHGSVPDIRASGEIIEAAAQILREFLALIPASLEADARLVARYLSEWICDYCEQTGTRRMNMRFSFGAGGIA